ncbi:MAG: hypothetical protein LBK01_06855 [Burkholderiaceae bacterium]|jgi:hypothetical protein|nr:hypothetical protein [Burkholderiaceae bacterium]
MQVENVTNPEWVNAEKTLLNVLVKFSEIDEVVPFTASPDDSEEHGREIFQKATTGEYGEIAEYIPPSPPLPEEQEAALSGAVQRHLDSTVRERGYDSILSACSYATSSNAQYAAEGLACAAWRDAVWEAFFSILDAVSDENYPGADEVIASLPALVWSGE